MYAYIKGTLSQLFPTHVVVETCGIGYEIQTPNSYRFQKYLEKEVQIYTSLIVREDAQLLYGFINEEEKEMFLRYLLQVHHMKLNWLSKMKMMLI